MVGPAGERALVHARDGVKPRGHAVAEGDGAGLVEQQRRDVTGGLDGASRHREHVVLHETVHAGDADGGQQPADGGGDQADQQRHQYGLGLGREQGGGKQGGKEQAEVGHVGRTKHGPAG